MITLKEYKELDQVNQKSVEVIIRAKLWSYLDEGDSMGVAKRKLFKTKQFSQNLINHIYVNSDDLVLHLRNKNIDKLKRRGVYAI